MNEHWYGFKWLGPFATPIAIVLSLLALIATFQSHADTIGWKVISTIVFLVSLVWSIWRESTGSDFYKDSAEKPVEFHL